MADVSDLRARIAAFNPTATKGVPLERVAHGVHLDRLRRMRKLWLQFEEEFPTIQPCGLESHPPLEVFEFFLEWRARTAQTGLLLPSKHITTATLVCEFDWIRTILRARTGCDVDKAKAKTIEQFVTNILPKNTPTRTVSRKKPVAMLADVEEILYFKWCCDEYQDPHPREINQVSCELIFMGNYGLRPGEIVEAGNHRGSDEGLTYGDVDLSLHYHNGAPRYQLRVQLRWRKRYRGISRDQDNLLFYEETQVERKAFCPIVHFLGLALADNVFTDLSLSELKTRRIPATTNSRSFTIREDKKDLPVFRSFSGPRKGGVKTAGALYGQLQALGQRCGYKDPISAYCFRRGFATGIDGQISEAKKRQLLSHVSDTTGQAYISNIIAVDAQHAIRGESQDTEYVKFASSIAYTRNLNAPQHHLAKMTSRSRHISKEEFEKTAILYPFHSRKEIMRRLRRRALLDARQSFFNAPPQDEMDNGVRAARVKPEPSRYFQNYLNYDKARQRVIHNFWKAKELTLEDAVRPLVILANPAKYQLHYPGMPRLGKDGACPYCKQVINGLPRPQHQLPPPLHILKCGLHHINMEQERKGQPDVGYCFQCATTYVPAHDTRHHREILNTFMTDPFCGIISRYEVVARPGYCPFCIAGFCSSQSLQLDCPLFENNAKHVNHIEEHLEDIIGESVSCPHPMCKDQPVFTSKYFFRVHLLDGHGIRKQGWPKEI